MKYDVDRSVAHSALSVDFEMECGCRIQLMTHTKHERDGSFEWMKDARDSLQLALLMAVNKHKCPERQENQA